MKLTFIGADHEVTGSCHYLNAAGKNILIDYGMEQGGNDQDVFSSRIEIMAASNPVLRCGLHLYHPRPYRPHGPFAVDLREGLQGSDLCDPGDL